MCVKGVCVWGGGVERMSDDTDDTNDTTDDDTSFRYQPTPT